ncbi:hypothetical protein E2C01_017808 [Portunus trituberculatus]|uniref:Uncharacterized protein n=1 Tax=Portunus trituberculatus TaxID=210409 RepID=A0A5B7DTH2_PORTR|nr:hypothetical protein [Portunus trituberculatus]
MLASTERQGAAEHKAGHERQPRQVTEAIKRRQKTSMEERPRAAPSCPPVYPAGEFTIFGLLSFIRRPPAPCSCKVARPSTSSLLRPPSPRLISCAFLLQCVVALGFTTPASFPGHPDQGTEGELRTGRRRQDCRYYLRKCLGTTIH